MSFVTRGLLVGGLALVVVVAPTVYYRAAYAHGKRLREVVPGRFYRSGQMTAAGFTDAVERLHLRTIVNVQDDFPDPEIRESFWGTATVRESELCRRLNVRFVQISPGLISRRHAPGQRPAAIDEFLAVMDDPATYPVLLHCHAGLHRTGILTAVYRMEYQGWPALAAFQELKAHGFGQWVCTSANDYVAQYVLEYVPRRDRPAGVARRDRSASGR